MDDIRGWRASYRSRCALIIGTAGSNGFTYSVVVLTSGSLGFAAPERTIIPPLCHTYSGIGALLLCGGAAGVAKVEDERHPTALAVLPFFNGARGAGGGVGATSVSGAYALN